MHFSDVPNFLRRSIGVTAIVLASAFFLGLPHHAFASKVLAVKFDAQDAPLSCEVASLKMALAFKGVKVSEAALMQNVGYDTTRRRSNTWGNPNKGFVGTLHGFQNVTGYGVHWEPIAKTAALYRPARVVKHWGIRNITTAIDAGNPVLMWGTYRVSTAHTDPWRTPDGTLIKAWYGEHTRVVIGYIGSAQNPSRIVLMDPVKGKLTWTIPEFKENWSHFEYNGVLVQ
ncbi:MAG: C39 family peptidase [Ilumatobacteraceae bacterium]